MNHVDYEHKRRAPKAFKSKGGIPNPTQFHYETHYSTCINFMGKLAHNYVHIRLFIQSTNFAFD